MLLYYIFYLTSITSEHTGTTNQHDIDYAFLVERTRGRSGADISGIVNELRKSRFLAAAALAQTVAGAAQVTPVTMKELLTTIDKFDRHRPRRAE